VEGSPDEQDGRPGSPSRRVDHPYPPRNPPNLWILVGLTALALVMAVLVLIATAL
jgi:hypothetical protein